MSTAASVQIPVSMVGSFPIAKSSDLAIGLGPFLVYKDRLIFRIESRVRPGLRERAYLTPPPRNLDRPTLEISCTITSGQDTNKVTVSPVPEWGGRYANADSAYFEITGNIPSSESLTVSYSYEHFNIAATNHVIDTADVLKARDLLE